MKNHLFHNCGTAGCPCIHQSSFNYMPSWMLHNTRLTVFPFKTGGYCYTGRYFMFLQQEADSTIALT